MPTVFIVDGSNFLFEGGRYVGAGRLERALTSLKAEYPEAEIVPFVDASATATAKRNNDEAELNSVRARCGVQVTPAGLGGKGDKFICLTAGTHLASGSEVKIVTGDSYKELQDEFGWLLDEDRFLDGRETARMWTWTARNAVRAYRDISKSGVATHPKHRRSTSRTSNLVLGENRRAQGAIKGGSVLAAVGVVGHHQEVFHIDEGVLRHRWHERGQWSDWHAMPLPVDAAPTAVAVGAHDQWVDLFIVTDDGALSHRYWGAEAGWSDWEDWGGGFRGSIAVSSAGSDHIEIWGQQSGGMVHRWNWDGEWSDWHLFG